MSWFMTILTGILIGAFLLKEYQYHHGLLPAWQALAFWATATTAWIILIRTFHSLDKDHSRI